MAEEEQNFVSGSDQPKRSRISRWTEAVTPTDRRAPEIPLNTFTYVPLDGSVGDQSFNRPSYRSPGKSIPPTSSQQVAAPTPRGSPASIRRQDQSIIRFWWHEVLACILFLGALLALFATLYAYEDKPSPDWPTWLSLNTIIAIYIVLLKTGILLVTAEGLGQLKWSWFSQGERPLHDLVTYDDATRGPFGATALLWRLRTHHLLSSLGALIIVLCLATEPFTQQIIRYDNCSVPSTTGEPPSIPRTNMYVEEGGIHTGASYEQITPPVQNSVLAGIFSPVGVPDVQCRTGNCSFPHEYSTLAWCSSCADITDELVFANKTTKFHYGNTTTTGWNYTTTLRSGDLSVGMVPATGVQNYSAMGATPYDKIDQRKSVVIASIDFLLAKSIYTEKVDGKYEPLDPTTGLPRVGCNTAAEAGSWPCQGYGASRCQLFPCVKTFNTSIASGKVHESLVDTSSAWGSSASWGLATMVDSTCLSTADRQELARGGYNLTASPRWQPLNSPDSHIKSNNATLTRLMEKGCVYAIDTTFMISFAGYLNSLFAGTVIGPALAYSSQIGQFSGPQVVQSFFNFADVTFDHVDSLFGNMTQSLTNYIRQNGYTYNTPATGIAYDNKTCIAVKWGFLAFPTALVVLTLIFFAVMIIETKPTHARPHIWKSSPLALLYHGLNRNKADEAPSPAIHTGAEEMGGMRAMAKATFVKLDRTSTGLTNLEVRTNEKTW